MKVEEGVTVMVGCQGCAERFLWTPPAGWWEHVPAFHSRTCQKRAARRRAALETYVRCPRPDKALYTTHKVAHADAVLLSKRQGQLLTQYRCICGGLHVGRIPFWAPSV